MGLRQNIDGIREIHVAIIDARNPPRICIGGAGAFRRDVNNWTQSELSHTIFVQVGERLGVVRIEGEGFSPFLPRGSCFLKELTLL